MNRPPIRVGAGTLGSCRQKEENTHFRHQTLDLRAATVFRLPINQNQSANAVGAEGAKAIADALRVNGSLTSLDLMVNDIGAEGAKALADALRVNGSLTKLDVKYNKLDGEAEALLCDAVKDKSGFELKVQ